MATPKIRVEMTQEEFPRYDPSHGTPDPMVRRLVTIKTPQGDATFEQTDYGHPGRFNDWDPRGVSPRLQPRTQDLRRLCSELGSLLA